MKYLLEELFEKFLDKRINTYIHRKSAEKEATFDENNFVAYYEPWRLLSVLAPLFICLCSTISLYLLHKTQGVWFWIGFVALVIILLVLVDTLTYRCYVDENGFTVKKFLVFKKFIPREEFFDVDITKWQPKDSDEEGLLTVRNEKGKKIFTASKDLVGFGLMCKMAKKFERKKNI